MLSQNVSGRVVAILAADGFAESELLTIRDALEGAHATVMVVSPSTGSRGRVMGAGGRDPEDLVPVDVPVASAVDTDFDALVIVGGPDSAELLRYDRRVLDFVMAFVDVHKPVGAIGAGILVLKEAAVVGGRQIAASAELEAELAAADGRRAEEPVFVDAGLITARSSQHIQSFLERLMEAIAASPMRAHREGTLTEKSTIQAGGLWQEGFSSSKTTE